MARILRRAGHEAYFAGGCVRDMLLGLTPKDFDVVTDARPERISELFDRTFQVGAAFGVVQVVLRGVPYEVATYRRDGPYRDGRRPESIEYSNQKEEDVQRRDFTINALLMDPETGQILDFVQGRADLRAGLIRAVGDPRRRFAEDRLRMLRAARFASRLDFEIEAETAAAIRELAAELTDVSAERIVAEVDAMLSADRPVAGLEMMEALGLGRSALPFLPPTPERRAEIYRAIDAAFLSNEPEVEDPEDRLAVCWALAFDTHGPDEAEAWMRRLKLSRDRIRRVRQLLSARELLQAPDDHAPIELARWAADPRGSVLLRYARGRGAAQAEARLDAWQARWQAQPLPARPVVGGNDLQALGLSPGPEFKRILQEVDDQVLQGRIGTREEAMAWLRAHYAPNSRG